MKKLALVAVAMFAFGGVAFGQTVVGTAHDLRAYTGGTESQVCIYCHTPHNSASGAAMLVPLWNHETTATATFGVYTGTGTLNATPGQPDGASKACLSCHDGTVAIENFGGATGGTHFAAGTALLSTDLSNDHPVSFVYDGALATADGALVTPNSTSQVDAAGEVPLFNSNLECASCHNVHDNTNVPFLRKDNTASALCTTCHIK